MDHREVGRLWNENAPAWTKLSRAGYDTYRDNLNTPAFLDLLPDVDGLLGLDIGCGEGTNTRLLAEKGALVTGIDIAHQFVRMAGKTNYPSPDINFLNASAVELPFAGESFDFATAFMSFMDIPETERLIKEAYRILKHGSFLQFSISHPCFDTPHRVNLRDEKGITYALEVGGYFNNLEGDIAEWLFSAAPPSETEGLLPFKTPRFTRTLSQWFNLLINTGFAIEKVEDPSPNDEVVQRCPNIQDAQVVAYFLHIRCRKWKTG